MAPLILSSDFHNDHMRFNRCMYVSDGTHMCIHTYNLYHNTRPISTSLLLININQITKVYY